MNEHYHRVMQARTSYPLKKTVLINPMLIQFVNEFGEEDEESRLRNKRIVDSFIEQLKDIYSQENKVHTISVDDKLFEYARKRANRVLDVNIEELRQLVIDGANWIIEQQNK